MTNGGMAFAGRQRAICSTDFVGFASAILDPPFVKGGLGGIIAHCSLSPPEAIPPLARFALRPSDARMPSAP